MNNPFWPKINEEGKQAFVYTPLTMTALESALADFFYGQPDEEMDFTATPLSEQEVEELITRPDSPYHKIIPGYPYMIYYSATIHTGYGGARMMYKNLLREGLTEAEIETMIYVLMGPGEGHPLSVLNVKNDGTE